jgi:hypothetical protein
MALPIIQAGSTTDPGSSPPIISQPFASPNLGGSLLFVLLATAGQILKSFGDSAGNGWISILDWSLSGKLFQARVCLSARSIASILRAQFAPGYPASTAFSYLWAEVAPPLGSVWSLDGGPFIPAKAASGTAVASPTISTTGAYTLLIAWATSTTAQVLTGGSGWIALANDGTNYLFYKVVTTPGNYQFTGTVPLSDASQSCIWAFKAAPGSPIPPGPAHQAAFLIRNT